MIKVAMLSRWHVHADDYARDIAKNENVAIQVVWDEELARGKKWANELDVAFEADLDIVLSHPEIDAVVVNTPTAMHKDIIIAAAENKKHIFTEKVLALTVEDCAAIYDAVEANGVELMVSLPRLTDKNYQHAEKAIEKGWIGKLTTFRCRFAHNGGVVQPGQTHGWLPARFFEKEQSGGGAMIDLGAHPIYLTNRLAGKATAVYARLQEVSNDKVDDNSALLLDYDSGALGVVETSFVSHGSPFQLELYGTEGTLLIENDTVHIHSQHVNGEEPTILEEDLPTLPMPMEQWVDAIQTGSRPTITKEDVIQLTLINEAAFKSSEEGRRIKV